MTQHDPNKIVVAALYKFAHLPDYRALKTPIYNFCQKHGIKGTLLLAEEGINGTISGTPHAIEACIDYLRADERLADTEVKYSKFQEKPFYRLKVKLKKEIVTLGVPTLDPHKTGTYVEPEDWNQLISDPDVQVIDTRNDYEVAIGTFAGAQNPNTQTFREFPEYVEKNLTPHKDKKIAMFCTGGIRCEKSTAYLKQQGFEKVYHLKGGILKYLESVPEKDSLWKGECFVFDNRVAVDHSLEKGKYAQCHGCRYPISEADMASPYYKEGVHCPHCYDSLTPEKANRAAERHKQVSLAKQHNRQHLGQPDLE